MVKRVLSPAEVVIAAFGGVRKTAKLLNRTPGTVSSWKRPCEQGGRGGRIPSTIQLPILELAKMMKINLTEADLIRGRTTTELTSTNTSSTPSNAQSQ